MTLENEKKRLWSLYKKHKDIELLNQMSYIDSIESDCIYFDKEKWLNRVIHKPEWRKYREIPNIPYKKEELYYCQNEVEIFVSQIICPDCGRECWDFEISIEEISVAFYCKKCSAHIYSYAFGGVVSGGDIEKCREELYDKGFKEAMNLKMKKLEDIY